MFVWRGLGQGSGLVEPGSWLARLIIPILFSSRIAATRSQPCLFLRSEQSLSDLNDLGSDLKMISSVWLLPSSSAFF